MKNELEALIEEATRKAFDIANEKLKRDYPYPEIFFDLRGTTAGMAYPVQYKIRYNIAIAQKNKKAFLQRTTYHEAAHLIAVMYFNCRCGHNRQWRYIMQNVFGLEPSRCHNYDVSGCRARKTYLHVYNCACGQEILVGTKHHRVIQANGTVFHKRCRLTISRAWFKRTIEKV